MFKNPINMVRAIIKHRILLIGVLIVFPIAVWLMAPALPFLLSLTFALGIFLLALQSVKLFGISIPSLIAVAIMAIVGTLTWMATDGFKLAQVSVSSAEISPYALFFVALLGVAILIGWSHE